ncbi:hypothetical protein SCHPADRAFT_944824 [Schizopora paradoxa]|uniref:Uncharacterized protein n=1 Tax=Schizopora paradoxa TaxID=27342 RepID=A0A0H2RT39_9AGAM|nr:hypothetical protein SCHPADRAFT_944824 [Schizopora paradoxa]
MVNLSLGKQHPSSELAKTVKTKKDVERCRFALTEPRASPSRTNDSFENAKIQFISRYQPKGPPSDLYTVSRNKQPKPPVKSEPERHHRATHRLSQKEAKLFREFQHNAALLSKDSPLSAIACVGSASPTIPEEDVHISSMPPARKPNITHLPSYTIPKPSSAEIVEEEVDSDAASKRQSFQSDTSDSSRCSDVTLVDHSNGEYDILRKYKERKDYADESTWRTASVIMRAYARQHPIPSRNDDWTVVPEARRPKGALRRSSAQRSPRLLRRTSSMKRQTSSHANN